MGYILSYEQHPLAEFNFGVTSLADDLRDGVRLVRLYEVVAGVSPLTLCKVSTHACFESRCACLDPILNSVLHIADTCRLSLFAGLVALSSLVSAAKGAQRQCCAGQL